VGLKLIRVPTFTVVGKGGKVPLLCVKCMFYKGSVNNDEENYKFAKSKTRSRFRIPPLGGRDRSTREV